MKEYIEKLLKEQREICAYNCRTLSAYQVELVLNAPSPAIDLSGVAKELDDEACFKIADDVIKLHDKFLETFPDREDENDSELRLCIVAGIKDALRLAAQQAPEPK